MSKIVVQGNSVLISSETHFLHHLIGSETCKIVKLSDKHEEVKADEEGTVLPSKIISATNQEKDVKINFVCSALSSDNSFLAIQSPGKELLVYNVQTWEVIYKRQLGRGASKILFSPDSKNIVVGDKTGDVFLYKIYSDEKETSLLGHLSMVLDIVMTKDSKHLITCDRDEKIRVSNYPNCYNIENYCLGHEQFVTNVQFLPHNNELLISCSGDGTVRLWDYLKGTLQNMYNFHNTRDESITPSAETKNQLKCFTSVQLDDKTSLLCVSVFKSNTIHVLFVKDGSFAVANKLDLSFEPVHLQLSRCQESKEIHLWLICNNELQLYAWNTTEKAFSNATNPLFLKTVEIIKSNLKELIVESSEDNVIYVLQKRKMDEITDYYLRKQARIEEKNKNKKIK
uniref:tRNA (Guanine-N(7)-)-methyltransferase non-catalytic subunit wdr4 n=1 Tax=Cacopsylla melanoneura TaxID=428564 RepID=A0A8D8SC79_9HEMI